MERFSLSVSFLLEVCVGRAWNLSITKKYILSEHHDYQIYARMMQCVCMLCTVQSKILRYLKL